MAEAGRRPAFIPSVIYKDNRAALKWLQNAFGFEIAEVLVDSNDNIVHAEMSHDGGVVMIGGEFTSWAKSPASAAGINTQRIHVHLERDIDGHCARAKAAGATVPMEPSDQFYGERTYMALDHEGHHWTFSQTVKPVTEADYNKAGFKTKKL
jgi:uncharacterized glyoxalase superfamily protein PhnB